jgi:hypothetical protein
MPFSQTSGGKAIDIDITEMGQNQRLGPIFRVAGRLPMTSKPVEIIGDSVPNRVWPLAPIGFKPRSLALAPAE